MIRPLAYLATAAAMAFAFTAPARSQSTEREEFRIPMSAAGPRGLEALIVKPVGGGRFPLVLISHGAPRKPEQRPNMTPLAFVPQANEFARRGFAAVVVMRRGYGSSGGDYAESNGACKNPDYLRSAAVAVADLRAAIAYLGTRHDVDTAQMIAVGQSAGGFASVALAAERPAGLRAVINFAGGRGSQADDEVCTSDRLVDAFRSFGRTARVPTLWVYSENDRYFGPQLAEQFRTVFIAGGGVVDFIRAPAFGEDGHRLFPAATALPKWTPYVDDFLQRRGLAPRAALLPAPAIALKPPPQLSANGRQAFAEYLAAAPHKAFAAGTRNGFAWRVGRRTLEEAKAAALEACAKFAPDCRIVAADDTAAP